MSKLQSLGFAIFSAGVLQLAQSFFNFPDEFDFGIMILSGFKNAVGNMPGSTAAANIADQGIQSLITIRFFVPIIIIVLIIVGLYLMFGSNSNN